MSCEDVRDRLPDHLLGHTDLEVVRHLRGCAACRSELASLDEGVVAFSFAAPDHEPPEELRLRVLSVLADEWTEPEAAAPVVARRRVRWLQPLAAAAVAVLVAVGVWGLVQSHRANSNQIAAASYHRFLSTLGGKAVREGRLVPSSTQPIQGSVVVYDSMEQQSWVLILARAPGFKGEAQVTLASPTQTMNLPPMEFQSNGDAYSIFVTPKDLSSFDRVTISAANGSVVASGSISS